MDTSVISENEAEELLADREYSRERTEPRPGDLYYLHLSDLLLALKAYGTNRSIRVLDYGAGFSPYRSLFPNADYRRADLANSLFKRDSSEGHGRFHYAINEDGTIPEASETFDLVLSTQVAEHVVCPEVYFRECFRLLQPGGELVLTTHGTFEDHGCPFDFQRWTAAGLSRDLKNAGFEVTSLLKLTTGPRAILFLIERFFESNSSFMSRRTVLGTCQWLTRSFIRRFRPRLHRTFDSHYSMFQMAPAGDENHSLYVALLACAKRPDASNLT